MTLDTFQTRDAGLDERIEALVAKRLSGEWSDEDQKDLDRLVALRHSHLLPIRRLSHRRFA